MAAENKKVTEQWSATGAPWKLIDGERATSVYGTVNGNTTRFPVAICQGSIRFEAEANARLISAAPELLAALQLFANLDTSVASDLWAIDKSYCEQARAALAKATQ